MSRHQAATSADRSHAIVDTQRCTGAERDKLGRLAVHSSLELVDKLRDLRVRAAAVEYLRWVS